METVKTFTTPGVMELKNHYFIRHGRVVLNLPKSQTRVVRDGSGSFDHVTIPFWLYMKNKEVVDELQKRSK